MHRLKPYLIPAATLLIIIAAMYGRSRNLAQRPMHTDEAVHAVKFGDLLENGRYRYDPTEYHGPALYYLSLPVALACGKNSFAELDETTLRLVPLFASLLFFLPLFHLRSIIGDKALPGAVAATALSPIITYYSRYYIHETLLAGFMFAFIAAALLYLHKPRLRYAVCAGIMAGFAAASKETFVISLAAAAVAGAATLLTEPQLRRNRLAAFRPVHIAIAGALAIAVIIILFSSFFTNPAGIADFFRAYGHTLSRAGGQGHEKPWWYYLQLLFYYHKGRGLTASEAWFIIPSAAAGILAFTRKIHNDILRAFLKFMTAYSGTLFVIYSILPYKMPWLALEWVQPMTAVAGIAAAHLLSTPGVRPLYKATAVIVTVLAIRNLSAQIRLENGPLASVEPRNPYVYGHTVTDITRLPKILENIAATEPQGHHLPIAVISDEYWPLPWYLRRFNRVSYTHTPQEFYAANAATKPHSGKPSTTDFPPVIITSAAGGSEIYPRIKSDYTDEVFGLRRGILLESFIRNDIWTNYIRSVTAQRKNENDH